MAERIRTLEAQIEALRQRLDAVQGELERLRQRQEESERRTALERLRREASAAVRGDTPALAPVDPTQRFVSGTRMQPQLNPEISVTGDLVAVGGDQEEERFQTRHVELDIRSYLDPYSRLHVVLAHEGGQHEPDPGHATEGEGTVRLDEGYITWSGLPGGLTLTVGRKRQQFGVLNRWHPHALDQTDPPWVLQESFGDHGLTATGLSVRWLLPGLWAHTQELTVEITDGDNTVAFAGSSWKHPSILARLASYWDLTGSSYLEVGLNALNGSADREGHLDHDLAALDVTYDWSPAGSERYRGLTLRGMLLRSVLDLPGGERRSAWGGYLYGQVRFSPRWTAGLRYDRVEDQRVAGRRYWGVSPYLTFWQSEWVRLRTQISFRSDDAAGIHRRYALQLTFAAGPHRHERY